MPSPAAATIVVLILQSDGSPLGLLISDGKRSGRLNPSALGAGVWLDTGDSSRLLRREEWLHSGPERPAELLQSGLMLAEAGRAVAGLEAQRSRPRTLLAWDGGPRWFFATSSACTLDALAKALAASRPAGWPVRHALNLDGGRSEIRVSAKLPGGPFFQRPLWNSPVRNFLVLVGP